MALSPIKIKEIVKKYQKDASDTGSAEVQIALLTEKINALTKHLSDSKKDHSSRRGLMKMVSARKGLLGYLKKSAQTRFEKVTKALDIRG